MKRKIALAAGMLLALTCTAWAQKTVSEARSSKVTATIETIDSTKSVEDIQKDIHWEGDHPAERASKGRLVFD